MNTKLLYFGIFILISGRLNSQTIEFIKDPNNHEVVLVKDSSYLINTGSSLIFYAIDVETNTRNVLLTDGMESTWLVPGGFNTLSKYFPFTSINEEIYVFRAGNTWYRTDVANKITDIFYDNESAGNQYEYLKLHQSESVNGIQNNLIIEARDKTSGDTIILFHRTENNTTAPFGKKIRIHKAGMPSMGSLKGNLIIASVFDEVTQSWGEVALYREFSTNLTRLLPLGSKTKYDVNFTILLGEDYVVDHLTDGTKKVYRYFRNTDTCTNVTTILFPDHTLLEFHNLKWTSYGHPLEPPISYNDYYWKGRNQSNEVQYFTSAALEAVEIADLKNVAQVDFMYSFHTPDSIYYYNYSNTQRGLMRYHKYNQGTKKDATSTPFNQEFKLKGHLDKMYFGRYNNQSGRIEAIVKNFPGNSYSYIQSGDGKRIENPLDFEFIDNKIFVLSRTAEGRKIAVFDPNGIVAIPGIEMYKDQISVYPNPASDNFNIAISDAILALPGLRLTINDASGNTLLTSPIWQQVSNIKLVGFQPGLKYLTIHTGTNTIYNKPLINMN
jgi:hypothetical protein